MNPPCTGRMSHVVSGHGRPRFTVLMFGFLFKLRLHIDDRLSGRELYMANTSPSVLRALHGDGSKAIGLVRLQWIFYGDSRQDRAQSCYLESCMSFIDITTYCYTYRYRPLTFIIYNRLTIALVYSCVFALPPKSPVRC